MAIINAYTTAIAEDSVAVNTPLIIPPKMIAGSPRTGSAFLKATSLSFAEHLLARRG